MDAEHVVSYDYSVVYFVENLASYFLCIMTNMGGNKLPDVATIWLISGAGIDHQASSLLLKCRSLQPNLFVRDPS